MAVSGFMPYYLRYGGCGGDAFIELSPVGTQEQQYTSSRSEKFLLRPTEALQYTNHHLGSVSLPPCP